MEGNDRTMWIFLDAVLCMEMITITLPKGLINKFLACCQYLEMLPLVLGSHFAKRDKKNKGSFQFMHLSSFIYSI